jgi:hypothetical protein
MIWRSTGFVAAAFVVAALALSLAPALLQLIGIPEFGFIGQLCFVVPALSLLESGLRRWRKP